MRGHAASFRAIPGRGLARGFAAAQPLVALLLAASCAQGPQPGIEGLWEVTSVRNLTKGEVQAHRREYHQFTASHQMVIVAGSDRPKLAKSVSDMTAEEFQSQQPVGAGLYRYQWDGSKVVRTNIAALSAYYEGGSFPGTLELEGDTLVLTDSHSADGDEREWTMRRVQ